jgi:hypothetical protein
MELKLEVGRTYFHLTFADPGLTMPGVEPLVYIGDADPIDGAQDHLFQDTISYSRFGSRFDLSEDGEGMKVCGIPTREIGTCVVDTESMAEEMRKAAERAKARNYPKLRVLRDGWKSENN